MEEFFLQIKVGVPSANRPQLYRYFTVDGEIWSTLDRNEAEEKVLELLEESPISIIDVISKRNKIVSVTIE